MSSAVPSSVASSISSRTTKSPLVSANVRAARWAITRRRRRIAWSGCKRACSAITSISSRCGAAACLRAISATCVDEIRWPVSATRTAASDTRGELAATTAPSANTMRYGLASAITVTWPVNPRSPSAASVRPHGRSVTVPRARSAIYRPRRPRRNRLVPTYATAAMATTITTIPTRVALPSAYPHISHRMEGLAVGVNGRRSARIAIR